MAVGEGEKVGKDEEENKAGFSDDADEAATTDGSA